jgi:precorrin-6A/cobalt-precorrin-6A reductase
MILILGGTSEASALARLIAARPDITALVSLAGATTRPSLPPIPHRVGGFGGADGLAAFLRDNCTEAVVDATHPFAERISANAAEACRITATPLLALRRPPWRAVEGDRWTEVSDAAEAAGAIGATRRRVFLTIGRLELPAFLGTQHDYLIRTIDPPERMPAGARLILARGPFAEEDERRLLEQERIEVVVTKNSGGEATYGKVAAARTLGLRVVLMRQPQRVAAESVATAEEALGWIEGRRGRG